MKLSLSIYRWLHRRNFSRKKMRGGFLHTRLGDRLLDKQLWRPTPESLARAWLIGIPITMVPFLPGQSVIAGVIGFFFRANILLCIGLQYLSNPLTAIVQLPACFFVGKLVQGHGPVETWHEVMQRDWKIFIEKPWLLARDLIPLYTGAVILGVAIALIGYGIILNFGHRWQQTRLRPVGKNGK